MSSKKVFITVAIVIALLLVMGALCWIASQTLFNPNFMWEEEGLSLYVQQDYLNRDGGIEATAFFPSYEEIQHCASVEFEMTGYDTVLSPSMLLTPRSAFMLTLSFSPEQEEAYQAQKSTALSAGNYQVTMIDPTVCIFTDGPTSFSDQVAIVIYDDSRMVLNYVFYYGTLYDEWINVDSSFFRHWPFDHGIFYENGDDSQM